jgi:aspartyl protease family protein
VFKFKSVLLIASLCIVALAILLRSERLVSLLGNPVDSLGKSLDAPVVLHANEKGHFFGNLSINGVSLKYIVDSGATNVTLNSDDANKAKIDYKKGDVVGLVTPGGEVQAFSLKLDALMIGTTVLDNVEATVVEGKSPPYVLLGISAQNKLDVKRDNSIMTLGRRR